MEFLLIIAIGIPLFLLFYPLYLGGKVRHLEHRLQQLERTQSVSTAQPVSFAPVLGAPGNPMPIPQNTTGAPAAFPQSQSVHVDQDNAFWVWLKEDFFVKSGALLLLLAFGWLVSYAFLNNWIGPVGRIVLGLFGGVLIMSLGIRRIHTHKHQGSIFVVLGSTTVLLTTYAARELYDMFTPLSALVLMFSSVVLVAFVSVRHNSERLAIAGLVLGSIAPGFTAAPAVDLPGLFLYLLLVALGTLWVVSMTGWSLLTLISMLVVFFYSVPYLIDGVSGGDQAVAMLFSFIFVSLYFVANLISLVRRRSQEHMQIHVFTALGSAFFLFLWINTAVDQQWQSLTYVAWALAFAVGTYIVFLYTSNVAAFYLYGATSVALIGAATAAELQGSMLTIAYLLEISLLLVAAAQLGAPSRVLERISVLLSIPVVLSLESIVSLAWRKGIFHSDFVVITLTISVLCLVGVFLYSRKDRDESLTAQKVLLSVSIMYAMVWVWLVMHALFADTIGTMFSLFTYTVTGIGLYIYGTLKHFTTVRYVGALLLVFVVSRLLLVDIWNMELAGKIITFFVIGILLISTAFIKKADASISGELR